VDPLADPLADTRPLTARSVVATCLLGSHLPTMPTSQLVQAAGMFGIGGGAVRTALWRMVAAGELDVDDGWYRLAGHLLERKGRVDDSSAGLTRPWDGTWELAVVAPESRPAADRQELRSAAAALHLAELREGVWARPDNLDPRRLPHQQAIVGDQCHRFFGATAPSQLRVFALDEWAVGASRLLAAIEAWADDDLAGGFRLSIAVVRHLQADPLLPDELLPAAWPGDELRRRYHEFDRTYQRRLAAALDTDPTRVTSDV
jgi:phenylacetic acid degradation operon negative regulatory protein